MSIWTTISEWYNKAATPQLVGWIPPQHVRPALVEAPCTAEQCYLRISLVQMVLAQSRAWFKDYQPTVQALTRLKFGNHLVELPSIAAADPARFAPGNSVLTNYHLLDLVPFRGGSLELSLALIALPGSDKLANGIKALSNVAGLIAAPLSGVLTFAGKIKESADLLVGSGAEVHLAYHNTLGSPPAAAGAPAPSHLRNGYIAIVCADPRVLGGATLVVDGEQLKLWDGAPGSQAQPLLGYDYALLRFEVVASRDDLRAFSDLEKLREEAISAFTKFGDEAGDKAYREALMAIQSHPELINADRRVLAAELKADCDSYRGSAHGMLQQPRRSWDEFVGALAPATDHAAFQIAEFT